MTKSMHCPVTGVNIPRFLLSTLVGFLFIFGLDYLVHQNLLMDLYEQTASFWRAEESMTDFFPLMIARTLLLAAIPAYIYTRNHEGKGIMEGLRFGIPLGLLFALFMSSSYIWMPIPLELAIGWAISGLVTGLGLGVIYSVTYKK